MRLAVRELEGERPVEKELGCVIPVARKIGPRTLLPLIGESVPRLGLWGLSRRSSRMEG
jgi:hypothetical protein